MEIRGRAVKSIPFFVRRKFQGEYDDWVNSLPSESQKVIERPHPSEWYSLKNALIEPTQKVCELFYDGNEEGAWELGRYSAELGLRTELSTVAEYGPDKLIEKAKLVLSWYYKGCEMRLEEKEDKIALQITDFSKCNELVEMRIGGWLEKAIEEVGGENVSVEITQSLAREDPVTEYLISWD